MKVKELIAELITVNPEFEVCQRLWLGDLCSGDISLLYCDDSVETVYLVSRPDNYVELVREMVATTAMKVKELIAELSKFNEEFKVYQKTYRSDSCHIDISEVYCHDTTIYLESDMHTYLDNYES